MKLHPLLVMTPIVGALAACSGSSDHDFAASEAERAAEVAAVSPPQALFNPDPAAPVLPFPNSLFFVGSTDGTLNFPIAADDDQTLSNPLVALNQQDGFSTTSPILTPVSEALDPASLRVGDTIRILEVTTQAGIAVTGVTGEISNPALLAAQEIDGQLVLVPTVPLKANTSYLVVLTNGITDASGDGLEAGFVFDLLKSPTVLADPSLEQLRQATGSQLLAAQGAGVNPEDVALSWVFKTQSIREVLQATKDQSGAGPLVLGDSQNDTSSVGGQGKANIYIGSLSIPYYQQAVGEDGNPLAALNSFWQNASTNVVGAIGGTGTPEYAPVATSIETIPVIMSVPNENSAGAGAMPPTGWPVTIFQHGITGNRTQMLAISDAMADAGRVVIGIDMPLHGLVDNTIPFHADNTPFDERERTFDIDVLPADGEIDGSGTHFYNLLNLANSRDNLRQAVADLFVLSASLSTAQVQGLTLDASNLNFVGHSLGGIVGGTMLSYSPEFQSATLAMPGGGIAQLLANSESFGPEIVAGLAGAGIEEGSADFNTFLTAAQTLVDSGDPINHATTLAASGNTQIHLIEVIGDTVVPNNVPTAPLSGTDPLARLLGLQQVAATTSGSALVKFTAGDHGSILSPAASLEATIEMQTQTATFAASQGALLPITDATVVQAVE